MAGASQPGGSSGAEALFALLAEVLDAVTTAPVPQVPFLRR